MTNTEDIKDLVNKYPEYRDKLFIRGFYFTDDNVDEHDYPFYDNWNKEKIGNYNLLVHNKQHYYIQKSDDDKKTLVLVGHAYNPFTMEPDENKILKELANIDKQDFWDKFNELTGIFTLIIVEKNKLKFVGDPCCQQSVFYGKINNHIYISTHSCLIGDLLKLKWDSYIKELVSYKFFPLLGNDLPGNLSQYKEIYQLLPNHCGLCKKNKDIELIRFYWPHILNLSNEDIAKEIGRLMHNNMILITQKWDRPAISMTGGCDSKTTIACANGLYDKFKLYSYSSSDAEELDANAAKDISKFMGFKHKTYKISRDDKDFDSDLEITRDILDYNTGNIIPTNKNDVRKRYYFNQIDDFDIEVKSWVSEALRAYFSKRFNNRENFGNKPTPRKCTTMYKFFLHNRRLVKKTDKAFEEYLEKYFKQAKENPLSWPEQFYWEQRQASGEGITITGQQRYSFDITIPYNNRKIMELFLSASVHDKIYDKIHSLIRQQMNPEIDEPNILVVNLKHTKNRACLENIYYTLHSHFPF